MEDIESCKGFERIMCYSWSAVEGDDQAMLRTLEFPAPVYHDWKASLSTLKGIAQSVTGSFVLSESLAEESQGNNDIRP